MKKICTFFLFAILSLTSLDARSPLKSFREVLEAGPDSNEAVAIAEATIMAANSAYCVAYDGTATLVIGAALMSHLDPGDKVSLSGMVLSFDNLLTVECTDINVLSTRNQLPPVDFTDLLALSKPDFSGQAIPVETEGILTVRESNVYLYSPDKLSPSLYPRTEVLLSSLLTSQLPNLENTFVKVRGYLIDYQNSGDVPRAKLVASSFDSPSGAPQMAIGAMRTNQLGSVRMITTVSAADSDRIEVCDFTGSFVMNKPEGVDVVPGQRAFLSLVKSEETSDYLLSSFRLLKGRTYADTVSLRLTHKDSPTYEFQFEPVEGGYVLRDIPFSGICLFNVYNHAQKIRFNSSSFSYAPNSPVPLYSSFQSGAISQQTQVPKGMYDVIYLPEAEDIIFIPLNKPYDESALKGHELKDQDGTILRGTIPFSKVDKKPSFRGGDANAFSQWVNSRLVYPDEAKLAHIQGRVTLQFTILEDGKIARIRVLRSAHPLLDAEAVRVLSLSPKWKPGRQDGKAVRVTYTFPVVFQCR